MALASPGELGRAALEGRAGSSSTAAAEEEVVVVAERQRRSRWMWASRALLRASGASGTEATGGGCPLPHLHRVAKLLWV